MRQWASQFRSYNPELVAASPWLIILAAALLGWNHVIELRAEEPRRAIVALEMFLRGSYIVPEIHGEPYFNKPPLFNWLIAGCIWLFGTTSEWVVRLPAALSFLILAFLQYRVVRLHVSRQVALWSVFILLTAADLLFYGTINTGEIDLFFAMLVFAQAAALFHFSSKGLWLAMYALCYGLAALGALTKGMPAVAFLVLSIFPWIIIAHHWRMLISWAHLAGIGLFVAILGGYFWLYSQQGDALGFALQLVFEATQRMEGATGGSILKSLWVFPALILKIMLPWSLFLFFLIRKGFWNGSRARPLVFFCLIFLIFNMPVYWLANYQKERYLYAFIPFLSIVLAYGFSLSANAWQSGLKVGMQQFLKVLIPITVLGVLSIPFIPTFSNVDFRWAKVLVVFLIGVGSYWVLRRSPGSLLGLFAFMVFLRVGVNLFYLPVLAAESSRMTYRAEIAKVLEISESDVVYWTGAPFEFKAEASFLGIDLAAANLSTPPLIAYQVPYYLSRCNGKVMQYHDTPQRGLYYLTHEDQLPKSLQITALYRFRDHSAGKDLVLFFMPSKTNI